MQSQIYVGGDWIPAPRFCIGDAVVYAVDAANEPGEFWHDRFNSAPRFFWWYRGVITGMAWDYGHECGGKWWKSGWLYAIRICQGYDNGTVPAWNSEPLELMEDEIKRSHYTAKLLREKSHKCWQLQLSEPTAKIKEGVC